MTHFQVPGDRVFAAQDTLSVWPGTAGGYRLFVTDSSGDERIGIHLGQKIELQLTSGMGCTLETSETQAVRVAAAVSGDVAMRLAATNPGPIALSDLSATSDQHRFSVSAKNAGGTILFAVDAAKNVKATLQVVVGKFENHPDMRVDLIADTCRGSDSLRIHALQRMLHSQFLGQDARGNDVFTNRDNVFEQHAPPEHLVGSENRRYDLRHRRAMAHGAGLPEKPGAESQLVLCRRDSRAPERHAH